MRKLYLIHSESEPFKELMNQVRSVGNTHAIDYDLACKKRVATLVNNSSLPFIESQKNIKFLEIIKDLAEKYNDVFYTDLMTWLSNWDGQRERIFVRVQDMRVINKLKRHYKRPIYVTIMLTETGSHLSHKFDLVIRTRDSVLFKKEISKFVKTKLYSMNFINIPKLKK